MVGERVDGAGGGWREHEPLDDPGRFEFFEAGGQQGWGAEAVLQVGVSLRPAEQLPDDQQRPTFPHDVERLGEGAVLLIRASPHHHNSLRDALRDQGTVVSALHVAYMDTDMTANLDVTKADPRAIARLAVDAIEVGALEVLADDTTRWVKSQLCAEITR